MSLGQIISGYFLFQLVFGAVILLLGWFVWDRRIKLKRHGKEVPAGFERTEEVSIDPVSKKKMRVYYHPGTGERFYKEEA